MPFERNENGVPQFPFDPKKPEECGCARCREDRDERNPSWPELPISSAMYILCPICGNKRCPHASDHNFDCTNSNSSGQLGSDYQ